MQSLMATKDGWLKRLAAISEKAHRVRWAKPLKLEAGVGIEPAYTALQAAA